MCESVHRASSVEAFFVRAKKLADACNIFRDTHVGISNAILLRRSYRATTMTHNPFHVIQYHTMRVKQENSAKIRVASWQEEIVCLVAVSFFGICGYRYYCRCSSMTPKLALKRIYFYSQQCEEKYQHGMNQK